MLPLQIFRCLHSRDMNVCTVNFAFEWYTLIGHGSQQDIAAEAAKCVRVTCSKKRIEATDAKIYLLNTVPRLDCFLDMIDGSTGAKLDFEAAHNIFSHPHCVQADVSNKNKQLVKNQQSSKGECFFRRGFPINNYRGLNHD